MMNPRIPTKAEIQKAYDLHYENIMYRPKRNKDWETVLITLTAVSIVYGETTNYLDKKVV